MTPTPSPPSSSSSWYGELGIGVTTEILDSAVVGDRVLPPEAGDEYKADYDMEIWGWAGNPDPSALLDIFRCEQIGNTSDSQYCNPEYDKLYELQLTQAGEERAKTLAEMQNLIYDEAPYDVLFYDANLDAYRNDRFAGWQNMPADGTPLFTYGTLQYTLLSDATAQPSPTPAAATEAPGLGGPRQRGPGNPDGLGGRRDGELGRWVEHDPPADRRPRGGGGRDRRGLPVPAAEGHARRRRVSPCDPLTVVTTPGGAVRRSRAETSRA